MSHGESDAVEERGLRVVRGNPSPEELAALLAVVRGVRRTERDRYEAWRAGRLAALRADPRHPARYR
jgi:hypothetical protein